MSFVDRLIRAVTRRVSFLDRASSEELIRRPVPDFPDIYPDGAVERILDITNGHPFLIQVICRELCQLLIRVRVLCATPEHVSAAIEGSTQATILFDERWSEFDDAQRAALRTLSESDEPQRLPKDEALRQLIHEEFVVDHEGLVAIAVPLFRDWIRECESLE